VTFRLRILQFCFTALLIAAAGHAATTSDVALQEILDREIARGQRTVTIPPGRYRVTPRDKQHLLLRNLQDVAINAEGVELICTQTTRALTFEHCSNVVLRGLSVDYDPLPFTQGRLTSISRDGLTHEIELSAGYPDTSTVQPWKYEIFASDTRELRCHTYHDIQVEKIDARRLRVRKSVQHGPFPERVGDRIVIASEFAPGGSVPHAMLLNNCKNVTLDNVAVYASNCFGFLEWSCSGTVYRRCRVDRRPVDNEIAARAEPRLRSLNADAFHSKHAVVGPSYEQCVARYQGDDGIAINGDFHLILSAAANKLRVLARSKHYPLMLQVGDSAELLTHRGERLNPLTITGAAASAPLTDEERAWIGTLAMDAGVRSAVLEAPVAELALAEPVTLERGALIAASNRLGNGFRIVDCVLGHNRSRGILVKASRGTITGNSISASWLTGILVTPEVYWLEAGISSDLTISGNTVTNCRAPAISAHAVFGEKIAPAGTLRNIEITGNQIRASAAPAIVLSSIAGLKLHGNSIEVDASLTAPDWVLPFRDIAREAIVRRNCENVSE